jgi:hypothetical protein
MYTGYMNLDSLCDFARCNPEVPHRTKDITLYQEYRAVVVELLKSVPCEAGWYIWYRSAAPNPPIYIGQSREGKTSSLQARLLEELLEEYVAFWSLVDSNAHTILSEKYNNKYNLSRAMRKRGADRIIWVSCAGAKRGTLDVVEHKLIWDLQPTANTDKRDYSDIHLHTYEHVRELVQQQLVTINGV